MRSRLHRRHLRLVPGLHHQVCLRPLLNDASLHRDEDALRASQCEMKRTPAFRLHDSGGDVCVRQQACSVSPATSAAQTTCQPGLLAVGTTNQTGGQRFGHPQLRDQRFHKHKLTVRIVFDKHIAAIGRQDQI